VRVLSPEQIEVATTRHIAAADLKYPYPFQNTATERQRYIRILEKYWRLGALFAAAIFSAIAIVTYSIIPVYESTARLEVDPPGSEAFSLATDNPGVIDEDYRDTQSEILKSDELAMAVIHKLSLDRNTIIVGKKISTGAVASVGNHVTQLTSAENTALRYYQEHLSVSLVRKSRVLEVKFATPDPHLSANVVNCLVDLFIEGNYKARYDAIMHASEWLSRQMDDIREKAILSNRALAEYQKAHGIVDVDEKQSSVSQKVVDLNHQLAQAKTDRIQLEAYLKGIHTSNEESLPQIRDNSMMQALTQRLIESRADLSQAQTIYGKKSPNVQKLEHHIDELQDQILAEEGKTVREIRTNYEAARARENLMSQEIKSATNEMSEMAQYNSLKREAQRDADLYTSLYARIKEAGITAASKSSNVRLVDQARVLDRPTWPRRRLNLAIGLVLALLGGVVVAFVREGFDNSIRTGEDVEKSTGLPSLTLVPAISVMLNGKSKKVGLPATSFFERPFSPEAEAIRGLQTSILLSHADNPPRSLLIASAFPKEGKTTVAINLALSLSQVGPTCLMDADLRKSGVAAALHLKCERGLSDVLRGSVPLKKALVGMRQSTRLAILPAGSLTGNLDELLTLDHMRNVLRELNESCQYVVIDSPPLVPYADARALSSMVDGVILVGRYGSTSRQAIGRCAQMLALLRAPVLGVVLNGVDLASADYRYYPCA
jgi:succinoglycan biosynthesis transport protein ExoP